MTRDELRKLARRHKADAPDVVLFEVPPGSRNFTSVQSTIAEAQAKADFAVHYRRRLSELRVADQREPERANVESVGVVEVAGAIGFAFGQRLRARHSVGRER